MLGIGKFKLGIRQKARLWKYYWLGYIVRSLRATELRLHAKFAKWVAGGEARSDFRHWELSANTTSRVSKL